MKLRVLNFVHAVLRLIGVLALVTAAQAAAAATLTITTTSLPTAYAGSSYTDKLTATGGSGKGYTWSITAGSLPAGVTLAASTGALSGKPKTAGTSTVTVEVKDSAADTAKATLKVTVDPALKITTTALTTAYTDAKYTATLKATGGSGSGDSWSVESGTLPTGLKLSTAGILSGTPTAAIVSTFVVQLKDSAANIATASLTLKVVPGLSITTDSLPVGYEGSTYSATLTASGGSDTGRTWSATGLPKNMSLTSAGVLSGTPISTATATIDAKVTDSASNVATATFSLRINPPATACSNDHPGTALVGLQGVYTLSLNQFNLDTNARYASIGSFNADGLGNITNGVIDSNGPEFATPTHTTFAGTYTVGSDGRGRMEITLAGTPAQSLAYCFALDSFATYRDFSDSAHATIIENDTSNIVASGELFAQSVSPTVLSVKGTWVLGLAGRQNNPQAGQPDFRHTVVGYVTFDGAGKIPSGEVDQNFDGVAAGEFGNLYEPQISLTGTYTLPVPSSGTPTGRGTLVVDEPLGFNQGVQADTFIFYPAGVNRLVVLQGDDAHPASGKDQSALIGTAIRRTGVPTSDATGLVGSTVNSQYFLTHPGTAQESAGLGIDVAVWDGSGNVTYSGDRNLAGVATTVAGSATYSVDTKGRFAVMIDGACSPCGYLATTNSGFALYDSPAQSLVLLERQVVPVGGDFQIASFQGAYSVGNRSFELEDQQTLDGAIISKGSGPFTGTLDENQQGDAEANQAVNQTESATSASGTHGRFLVTDHASGVTSAFYIVSPNEAVSLPIAGSETQTLPILQHLHQ
jgi:hypothetical protein